MTQMTRFDVELGKDFTKIDDFQVFPSFSSTQSGYIFNIFLSQNLSGIAEAY